MSLLLSLIPMPLLSLILIPLLSPIPMSLLSLIRMHLLSPNRESLYPFSGFSQKMPKLTKFGKII